ncbi:MAG: hypothetical protein QG597_1047 [Actinomycetota bacterium]|nr:hypothetical protein [Actinomycetota bacterium]
MGMTGLVATLNIAAYDLAVGGPSPSTSANEVSASSPSPSATEAPPVEPLEFTEVAVTLGVLLIALIATGVIVLAFRRGYWFSLRKGTPVEPGQQQPMSASPSERIEGDTFVRSVLALWLVVGLLVLAVMSFGIADSTLRSTLIGGITASAGGAIAFYFSTKAAGDARRDLLSASAGEMVGVPDVVGQTVAQAQALFAAMPGLKLAVRVEPSAATLALTDVVTAQTPLAGVRVGRDTTVTVTAGAPDPTPADPTPDQPAPDQPAGVEPTDRQMS